jgi:hypothetical protein
MGFDSSRDRLDISFSKTLMGSDFMRKMLDSLRLDAFVVVKIFLLHRSIANLPYRLLGIQMQRGETM